MTAKSDSLHVLAIDLSVLATPSMESGPLAAKAYADTLGDWSSALKEKWIEVWLSRWAWDSLANDGKFPDRVTLTALLSGVVEHSANTVALVVDRFLDVEPSFQDAALLGEMLFENTTVDPELDGSVGGPKMAAERERMLMSLALLNDYCKPPISNMTLAISTQHATSEVLVKGQIHDIEHRRTDLRDYPHAPEEMCGRVAVRTSFEHFLEKADAGRLWNAAEDDDKGKKQAIKLACYQFRLANSQSRREQNEVPSWDEEPPTYRFGWKFLARAREICVSADNGLASRLLRAMTEALYKQNRGSEHALKLGKDNGPPGQKRRKDKSWRRDIDYEYHLHYWECDHGLIEFGWIGPHNDFTLPE